MSLQDMATLLNTSRERQRQVEELALRRAAKRAKKSTLMDWYG
jgi:DNA-directed RNA polymerase sigma subunit (sigma70/sigma32)